MGKKNSNRSSYIGLIKFGFYFSTKVIFRLPFLLFDFLIIRHSWMYFSVIVYSIKNVYYLMIFCVCINYFLVSKWVITTSRNIYIFIFIRLLSSDGAWRRRRLFPRRHGNFVSIDPGAVSTPRRNVFLNSKQSDGGFV